MNPTGFWATPLLSAVGFLCLFFQSLMVMAAVDTPAHQAALKFMRGVNFGNSLEYAVGDPTGGTVYSSIDFSTARSEGFDHIRIPVAWHLYTGPSPAFTLNPSIFTKVDSMINSALSKGLAVIINEHHFIKFMANPGTNKVEFYAIWRQVAEHYAAKSESVAFELLNEPNASDGNTATTQVMNPIYAEAIRQIRLTNPTRPIFVGPGGFNSVDELANLTLPSSDLNLIVTVHNYDPYYFTHQGAEWGLPDTATIGVLFPGPPAVTLKPPASITDAWVLDWFKNYNTKTGTLNPSSVGTIRSKLSIARNWATSRGRPVHVGEFGCYQKADPASRVGYYSAARTVLDEYGLGWAMWDWKSGFHYLQNGKPEPSGMREAMFPSFQLITSTEGMIKFAAAKGKTYIVERAASISMPIVWAGILTQTMNSPNFSFTDGEFHQKEGGYYRVKWVK